MQCKIQWPRWKPGGPELCAVQGARRVTGDGGRKAYSRGEHTMDAFMLRDFPSIVRLKGTRGWRQLFKSGGGEHPSRERVPPDQVSRSFFSAHEQVFSRNVQILKMCEAKMCMAPVPDRCIFTPQS